MLNNLTFRRHCLIHPVWYSLVTSLIVFLNVYVLLIMSMDTIIGPEGYLRTREYKGILLWVQCEEIQIPFLVLRPSLLYLLRVWIITVTYLWRVWLAFMIVFNAFISFTFRFELVSLAESLCQLGMGLRPTSAHCLSIGS